MPARANNPSAPRVIQHPEPPKTSWAGTTTQSPDPLAKARYLPTVAPIGKRSEHELPNMHKHRIRRSKLELHGPMNGLSIDPRSSREVRSAP
eukprot:4653159-Alexandrium_andersonii.AAC.1